MRIKDIEPIKEDADKPAPKTQAPVKPQLETDADGFCDERWAEVAAEVARQVETGEWINATNWTDEELARFIASR